MYNKINFTDEILDTYKGESSPVFELVNVDTDEYRLSLKNTILQAGTGLQKLTLDKVDNFLQIVDRYLFLIDDTDLTYTGDNLTGVTEKISTVLFRSTTLAYTGSQLDTVTVVYYDTDGTTELLNYTDTLTYTTGKLTGVDRVVN